MVEIGAVKFQNEDAQFKVSGSDTKKVLFGKLGHKAAERWDKDTKGMNSIFTQGRCCFCFCCLLFSKAATNHRTVFEQ